jgi:hypothetical protein
MPKLSDAINKVNQEEAHRKKPVKRRPYLDNIAPISAVEEPVIAKPKAKTILIAEPPEELLKAQIIPAEKIEIDRVVGEDTTTFAPVKQTIAEKPLVTLEEEIPITKSLPPVEKKLKPVNSNLSEELVESLTPKAAEKYKPTPTLINNSKSQFLQDGRNWDAPATRRVPEHDVRVSTVNPKGTMGTDEEDGVDLSLYNIEQFGHTTKTVLFYIFRKAKENKCLVTPPLKKNDLQKECGINFNTIKSVLQRLSHYKFIKLEKFQRGPFGWTRYSIRESLYNQLLYNFDGIMPTQRPDKHPTQFAENNYAEVGEEITLADSLKEIGFNMGHVRQLQKMNMSSDKIQNSLDAFAFDMQDKEFKLKIRSPLAVFMKVAKTEGEYISSRGYISPEDEILQQMITLKKDRALQIKKQQDELLNLSFNEWLSTKSREEIIKIAPPSGDYLGPLHQATLKNWYFENIQK